MMVLLPHQSSWTGIGRDPLGMVSMDPTAYPQKASRFSSSFTSDQAESQLPKYDWQTVRERQRKQPEGVGTAREQRVRGPFSRLCSLLSRLYDSDRANHSMTKSSLRHIGLEEPWTAEKVMGFLNQNNAMPYWSEESGLVIRRQGPRGAALLPDKHLVGKDTRQRFQEILKVDGKERARELRLRLKAM